jgi:hypothetical protein
MECSNFLDKRLVDARRSRLWTFCQQEARRRCSVAPETAAATTPSPCTTTSRKLPPPPLPPPQYLLLPSKSSSSATTKAVHMESEKEPSLPLSLSARSLWHSLALLPGKKSCRELAAATSASWSLCYNTSTARRRRRRRLESLFLFPSTPSWRWA